MLTGGNKSGPLFSLYECYFLHTRDLFNLKQTQTAMEPCTCLPLFFACMAWIKAPCVGQSAHCTLVICLVFRVSHKQLWLFMNLLIKRKLVRELLSGLRDHVATCDRKMQEGVRKETLSHSLSWLIWCQEVTWERSMWKNALVITCIQKEKFYVKN